MGTANDVGREQQTLRLPNRTWAFLALRFFLGIRLIIAGVVKFEREGEYGWDAYVTNMSTMAKGIADSSFLLDWMTKPFAFILPWLLLVVGALLVLGLKVRKTLIAACLLFLMLGFGLMAVQEDQGVVNIAVYIGLTAFALLLAEHDRFSIWKD